MHPSEIALGNTPASPIDARVFSKVAKWNRIFAVFPKDLPSCTLLCITYGMIYVTE